MIGSIAHLTSQMASLYDELEAARVNERTAAGAHGLASFRLRVVENELAQAEAEFAKLIMAQVRVRTVQDPGSNAVTFSFETPHDLFDDLPKGGDQ